MASKAEIAALRREVHKLASRLGGLVGGKVRNPRKGFGTGDNARRAALARWGRSRSGAK